MSLAGRTIVAAAHTPERNAAGQLTACTAQCSFERRVAQEREAGNHIMICGNGNNVCVLLRAAEGMAMNEKPRQVCYCKANIFIVCLCAPAVPADSLQQIVENYSG